MSPQSEWEYVMRCVEEEDRHPSDEHLARLVRDYGVPPYALDYVASRIPHGPGARPMREPPDWGYFGRFKAEQAGALMDLLHLHAELAEYETREYGPTKRTIETECLLPLDSDSLEPLTVEVELRKVKSRGVWRVKAPKEQARRIVARRYHVEPATLGDWEREFRESPDRLGEVF